MPAQGKTFAGRMETTAPLMRQDQVESFVEEGKRITSMLNDRSPHVASAIQDRDASVRQLSKINQQIEQQMPRPFEPDELDKAVARERELRSRWTLGMPTHSEMRQAPAGAVDKHILWEERNKNDILEWKNIRRRLLASGAIDAPMNSRDIANVEAFRPWGGSQELNMDNTIVQAKKFYGGQDSVVFSPDEIDVLRNLDEGLAAKLALLTPDVRAEVKAVLAKHMGEPLAEETQEETPPKGGAAKKKE